MIKGLLTRRKLEKPTTQKQEVLYMLLTHKRVSRADLFNKAHILNSPEKIRQLRKDHGLIIQTHTVHTINKFGREVRFGVYELKEPYYGRLVYKQLKALEI